MTSSKTVIDIFGLLTTIATFFMGRTAKVSPKEKRDTLINACGAIVVVFFVANIATAYMPSVPNAVFLILSILQIRWTRYLLYLLIVVLAVYPSLRAKRDRKTSPSIASPGYAKANCFFNCAGAANAIAMLWIIYEEIDDFRFLENFYIETIIQFLFPLCMMIAFSYQSIEQENADELDHDPSLKWPNQMWNLMHLFSTYFWALFSGAMMLSYTCYCYIYHMTLTLNWRYLVFLSLGLVFFYSCSNHRHEYIYMIFLTGVPAFLIGSAQWMSWFTVDEQVRQYQMIFFAGHVSIYMILIFIRMGLIVRKKGTHTGIEYPSLRRLFWGVPLLVTLVMYAILWLVPGALGADRISLNNAEECLTMICLDTDKDSAALLEEIKQSEWFDPENEQVDQTRFLRFLYDHLREELVSKEVISDKAQTVTYEELDKWRDDQPFR